MFWKKSYYGTERPVVLITGASQGLGLEITKQLIASNKYRVVTTARASSLQRFEAEGIQDGENVLVRTLDVLKLTDRKKLFQEIQKHWGGVDVLINNAGYLLRAVVEHVGEIERFKQIDTNFRAPMALIKQALPYMRQKRRGHIINVSSVGGMMAMPTMAVYSASKFALEGATEALWYEARPWNIRVSLIQPGFINSDSFSKVRYTKTSEKASADKNNPYYEHYSSMVPFIEKIMKISPSNERKVARTILKIIASSNPPLRVAGTLDAHIFGLLRRLLPRQFFLRFLYFFLPNISYWGRD